MLTLLYNSNGSPGYNAKYQQQKHEKGPLQRRGSKGFIR